jgi:hypothetical protein
MPYGSSRGDFRWETLAVGGGVHSSLTLKREARQRSDALRVELRWGLSWRRGTMGREQAGLPDQSFNWETPSMIPHCARIKGDPLAPTVVPLPAPALEKKPP